MPLLGVKIHNKCFYLEGFGDSGLGGIVNLSLPDAPAAALPQLTQTEAQILLICIIFNLEKHIKNKIKKIKQVSKKKVLLQADRHYMPSIFTLTFTVSEVVIVDFFSPVSLKWSRQLWNTSWLKTALFLIFLKFTVFSQSPGQNVLLYWREIRALTTVSSFLVKPQFIL